jgi:hypothetical protein
LSTIKVKNVYLNFNKSKQHVTLPEDFLHI